MLLNRPVPAPPLSLVNAAAEVVVDESISIVPPTLPEVYVAIKKISLVSHRASVGSIRNICTMLVRRP